MKLARVVLAVILTINALISGLMAAAAMQDYDARESGLHWLFLLVALACFFGAVACVD